MNLVYEDEYGAYSGVRPDFLKKFVPREINPNFEAYDSIDGQNRFIASKCSRIPGDEEPAAGRFGIDFNRGKPTLAEALEYGSVLPHGYNWLSDIAFGATTKEEYEKRPRSGIVFTPSYGIHHRRRSGLHRIRVALTGRRMK